MRKIVAIISAALLAGSALLAQDSVQTRILERLKPVMAKDFTPTYTDIAILSTPWLSGTAVQAGYNWSKEKNAVMTQNGDGLSLGEFRATSLKMLDRGDAVEGGVSYQRGVKKNVLWNTTSDFELLYPYVMADTVGGNLQTEQYSFYGRYAGVIGDAWKYGLSGSYRALHEYRSADPRPRNITSDISISVSAGRRLAAAHTLSLMASYRRYHQLQAVSFMNPRGANTAEFHMTGLGSTFARFTGTGNFTDLRYRGSGFSVAAMLQPLGADGFTAGADYRAFKSRRHLVDQNEAPYTELLTQNVSAFASYRRTGGRFSYGARLSLGYELRQGSDAIVPASISSGVDDIPWLTLYRNRLPSASIAGVLQWDRGGNIWALEPYAGAEGSRAVRRESSSKMEYHGFTGGAAASYTTVRGKITSQLKVCGGYTIRPDGSFKLPESVEAFMYDRYADIYAFFTENMTQMRLQAKVLYSTGNVNVFLHPDIGLKFWGKDGRAASVNISAGIEF